MDSRARPEHRHQHQPGGGQAGIQARAGPHRLRDRAKDKHAIVEDDHQRGRHHRLFRSHSQRAGQDGDDRPSLPCRRASRADAGVKRQQVEQRHHRFSALRQIVDRFGVQRMEGPQQRHRKRQIDGFAVEAGGKIVLTQRPMDNPEQGERTSQVYGDVPGMVAADIQAVECVVQRKRRVDHRASGDGQLTLGDEQARETPPLANLTVFDDREHVVHDERPRETVRVHTQPNRYQKSGPAPRACGRDRRVSRNVGAVGRARSRRPAGRVSSLRRTIRGGSLGRPVEGKRGYLSLDCAATCLRVS